MPAIIDQEVTEYIVVGSGAGGGTLATRLAENGATVTLLEAGRDPRREGVKGLPEDYDVPAFHANASENEEFRWNFFVRHYRDLIQQKRDDKYVDFYNDKDKPVDGVLYPRTGALGGCTAHNAMILVYPHNSDWDEIAAATHDASWGADNMRRYFERLENCRYHPISRIFEKHLWNPTRHGWDGWLSSEKALPVKALLHDKELADVLVDSVYEAFQASNHKPEDLDGFVLGGGDPNDWRVVQKNSEGLRFTPLATRDHARMGTRERILEVAKQFPDRLKIVTDALVSRVLLDDNKRAVGVEYLAGEKLYRAHEKPGMAPGELHERHSSREVILSGGAFNTPQILMLSGIGPRIELEKHGIAVSVDLPGVGRNLQDRYEVGVVNRMNFEHWKALEGATFDKNDPLFNDWMQSREGVYTTNGAVLGAILRSFPQRPLPDLFVFALLSYFKGYYPGYSREFARNLNCLTWAVLKAHTVNRAGEVTLRSADPQDMPQVNFNYFQEGNDTAGEDLKSVVEGIRFVRHLTKDLKALGLIKEELLPGDAKQTDEELASFVRDNAWGHHASCTCSIGPREDGGVLDSQFRVHGVEGLRVVDASVFPRIPGFFIVCAIYMIAEKAADVILAAR
jgi:choline dehydrogenase